MGRVGLSFAFLFLHCLLELVFVSSLLRMGRVCPLFSYVCFVCVCLCRVHVLCVRTLLLFMDVRMMCSLCSLCTYVVNDVYGE